MKLRDHAYRAIHNTFVRMGALPAVAPMARFAFTPSEITDLRRSASNDMQREFFAGGKRPAYKWHHYLEVYEQFLSKYRGKPFFFLEIGVSAGGSLELWRRYFGPEAIIVGIDIDPACASRVDPPNIVRIGSQADPQFLKHVVEEFGEPDAVLDDGSHIGRHQQASFDILFPLLKNGGLYIIEDLQTSYWPDWEGGYHRRGSGIEYVKQMIDDMHAWYHNRKTKTPARDDIKAIHIYDSVSVIEKSRKPRPGFLEA
jgi:cephalosporin hydroxylase